MTIIETNKECLAMDARRDVGFYAPLYRARCALDISTEKAKVPLSVESAEVSRSSAAPADTTLLGPQYIVVRPCINYRYCNEWSILQAEFTRALTQSRDSDRQHLPCSLFPYAAVATAANCAASHHGFYRVPPKAPPCNTTGCEILVANLRLWYLPFSHGEMSKRNPVTNCWIKSIYHMRNHTSIVYLKSMHVGIFRSLYCIRRTCCWLEIF